MHSDPTPYIAFTALACFVIGFFACGIICARRIRRAEIDGWKQGVRFYQDRAADSRQPRL
jgi:hypothetical protein